MPHCYSFKSFTLHSWHIYIYTYALFTCKPKCPCSNACKDPKSDVEHLLHGPPFTNDWDDKLSRSKYLRGNETTIPGILSLEFRSNHSWSLTLVSNTHTNIWAHSLRPIQNILKPINPTCGHCTSPRYLTISGAPQKLGPSSPSESACTLGCSHLHGCAVLRSFRAVERLNGFSPGAWRGAQWLQWHNLGHEEWWHSLANWPGKWCTGWRSCQTLAQALFQEPSGWGQLGCGCRQWHGHPAPNDGMRSYQQLTPRWGSLNSDVELLGWSFILSPGTTQNMFVM